MNPYLICLLIVNLLTSIGTMIVAFGMLLELRELVPVLKDVVQRIVHALNE